MKYRGLNQILSAAIVNKRFRQRLLNHPEKAIMEGYLDFDFQLTAFEKQYTESIQVNSIEEFAEHIYSWITNQISADNPEKELFIQTSHMETKKPIHLNVYKHIFLN